MPTPPAELVASMAEALLDPRLDVRRATLARLKEIYVHCEDDHCVTDPAVAREALPHATRALADPDPEIRVTGAQALELFAADAEGSVFDLARALADPVAAVRYVALEALCEFCGAAAPVVPQVAAHLGRAETPDERSAAIAVLGNAGATADHLDVVLEALLCDVPAVQASAAHALGFALDDEREEPRRRVSQALQRLLRPR